MGVQADPRYTSRVARPRYGNEQARMYSSGRYPTDGVLPEPELSPISRKVKHFEKYSRMGGRWSWNRPSYERDVVSLVKAERKMEEGIAAALTEVEAVEAGLRYFDELIMPQPKGAPAPTNAAHRGQAQGRPPRLASNQVASEERNPVDEKRAHGSTKLGRVYRSAGREGAGGNSAVARCLDLKLTLKQRLDNYDRQRGINIPQPANTGETSTVTAIPDGSSHGGVFAPCEGGALGRPGEAGGVAQIVARSLGNAVIAVRQSSKADLNTKGGGVDNGGSGKGRRRGDSGSVRSRWRSWEETPPPALSGPAPTVNREKHERHNGASSRATAVANGASDGTAPPRTTVDSSSSPCPSSAASRNGAPLVPRVAALAADINARKKSGEDDDSMVPPRRTKEFDPDKLECVRRHEASVVERAQRVQSLRAEAEKKTLFRARPLPGFLAGGGGNSGIDDGGQADRGRGRIGEAEIQPELLFAALEEDQEARELLEKIKRINPRADIASILLPSTTTTATAAAASSAPPTGTSKHASVAGLELPPSRYNAPSATAAFTTSENTAAPRNGLLTVTAEESYQAQPRQQRRSPRLQHGKAEQHPDGIPAGASVEYQTQGFGIAKAPDSRVWVGLGMGFGVAGRDRVEGKEGARRASGAAPSSLMGRMLGSGMLDRQREWEKARGRKVMESRRKAEEAKEQEGKGDILEAGFSERSWLSAKTQHLRSLERQKADEEARELLREARRKASALRAQREREAAQKKVASIASALSATDTAGLESRSAPSSRGGSRKPRKPPPPRRVKSHSGAGATSGEPSDALPLSAAAGPDPSPDAVGRRRRSGSGSSKASARSNNSAATVPADVEKLSADDFYRVAVEAILERERSARGRGTGRGTDSGSNNGGTGEGTGGGTGGKTGTRTVRALAEKNATGDACQWEDGGCESGLDEGVAGLARGREYDDGACRSSANRQLFGNGGGGRNLRNIRERNGGGGGAGGRFRRRRSVDARRLGIGETKKQWTIRDYSQDPHSGVTSAIGRKKGKPSGTMRVPHTSALGGAAPRGRRSYHPPRGGSNPPHPSGDSRDVGRSSSLLSLFEAQSVEQVAGGTWSALDVQGKERPIMGNAGAGDWRGGSLWQEQRKLSHPAVATATATTSARGIDVGDLPWSDVARPRGRGNDAHHNSDETRGAVITRTSPRGEDARDDVDGRAESSSSSGRSDASLRSERKITEEALSPDQWEQRLSLAETELARRGSGGATVARTKVDVEIEDDEEGWFSADLNPTRLQSSAKPYPGDRPIAGASHGAIESEDRWDDTVINRGGHGGADADRGLRMPRPPQDGAAERRITRERRKSWEGAPPSVERNRGNSTYSSAGEGQGGGERRVAGDSAAKAVRDSFPGRRGSPKQERNPAEQGERYTTGGATEAADKSERTKAAARAHGRARVDGDPLDASAKVYDDGEDDDATHIKGEPLNRGGGCGGFSLWSSSDGEASIEDILDESLRENKKGRYHAFDGGRGDFFVAGAGGGGGVGEMTAAGEDGERLQRNAGYDEGGAVKEGCDYAASSLSPLRRHREAFFDPATSSADKGRLKVSDPRLFDPCSMRRRPDFLQYRPGGANQEGGRGEGGAVTAGVTLLLGRRADNISSDTSVDAGEIRQEQVITVMFDRFKFNEQEARSWWTLNRARILRGTRPSYSRPDLAGGIEDGSSI